MEVRYYRDPQKGLPHIYDHGVTEAEAEWVLGSPWRRRILLRRLTAGTGADGGRAVSARGVRPR